MAPEPQHLDEDTVISLAQGALAGEALAHAEEHLASCSPCRTLLADSMRDAELALSDLADPERAHSLPEGELEVPLPGTVLIEKYRVESVIGSGGMGVVLAATHLLLGSRVAIKVLRRPGPSEIARFLREARVSAQIKNRHIARVFDFGQLPNGAPFLVMEFLEGRDLAQLIEQGALAVQVAVDYVLQACDALAQVHALGIVHRDLKPANLFLADDQGEELVKVLDFGVFKSIAGGALDVASTQLTGQHALIGSPVYMSPEQMRGAEIDARSDVWSLGVILYELLTSELPFGERTLSALAIAVASEEPIAPTKLRAGIPRELEAVILRCLRKRPEDRYADATALREALLGMRGDRKKSRGVLGLALLAAVVTGGAFWMLAMQAEKPAQPLPLVMPTLVEHAPEPVKAEEQPAPPTPRAAPDGAVESGPARAARKHKPNKPHAPAKPSVGPTDTPD